MDKKSLLAISLCFLIFMAWQKLYLEPRTVPSANVSTLTAPQASSEPVQTLTPAPSTVQPTAPQTKHAPVTLSLPTSIGTLQVGDGHSYFNEWTLSEYHRGISKESEPIDLSGVTNKSTLLDLAFDDPSFSYLADVQGTLTSTPNGAVWVYEDSKIKLTRTYKAGNSVSFVDVDTVATFKNKVPRFAFFSIGVQGLEKDPEEQDRQVFLWKKDSIERHLTHSSLDLAEVPSPVDYMGIANRYFTFAVVSQAPLSPKALLQPMGPKNHKVSLVYPVLGNELHVPFRTYFGPKELKSLRAVDGRLDLIVDFGWFTWFAYPLLRTLQGFYGMVSNYGFAIILLTLLVKILTYPLTYKSMKSMREMARLQPQLAKLREKYANDKEALNREMITLMRSHGYNPMAGCLPMLIQMPVFFALYKVLYSSIELYHAPGFLWIHDLSSKDPTYVTPVFLTAIMFIQQKLTPNTSTDPAQQKMLQFMPVIFGFMMINLAAGLTLYMLTNALAGIFQQMLLNKKLGPMPTALAKAGGTKA